MRENTTPRQYEAWIKSVTIESAEEKPEGVTFRLGIPGLMYKDWISNNVLNVFEEAFSQFYSQPFNFEFSVTQKQEEADTYNPPAQNAFTVQVSKTIEETRGPKLRPEYTFLNFVVGKSNEFAHAACHSISEKPGKAVNPLFLCGPSGTGKTHLLNAIGIAIRENFPHMRICYISGERFINEVISGIRHKQMDKFHQKYRQSYDILIIDDIHEIANKEATQEEFFHTFNAFQEAGKQVVVAADKLPSEIEGLEDRIRTRLSWGLTADIKAPEYETRVAILRFKAEKLGINVPDEVIAMIAEMSKRTVRELEGHLNTLRMYSELNGQPITVELARNIFGSVLASKKNGLTIDDVLRLVADFYGISTKDLKGQSKVKTVAWPRQIAMVLCTKILNLGYSEIGRAIGGRDHATIIHGVKKVELKLSEDPSLFSEFSRLESTINNSQLNNM